MLTVYIYIYICIHRVNMLGNGIYFHHSILSLVLTQGTIEICSPYPKFVLTGVLSINKALRGQKQCSYTVNTDVFFH